MPEQKASPLQTEFEFTLPKGYIDAEGNLHRKGIMRLATAMDEIAPLREARVKNNQAYLTVAILARVVTRLGGIQEVTPEIIEALFTADVAYLQDFYRQINSDGAGQLTITCPECAHVFQVEANPSGG
jgi:hypothetical protein